MSGEKYQPGNSTEGAIFENAFCERCKHEDFDLDMLCDIHTNALFLTATDPDYPQEWTYNDKGKPTCTAFEEVPNE